MNTKITYLKILGVIVSAYLLVSFLGREVFVANTPRLRPSLDKYLTLRMRLVTNDVAQLASSFFRKSAEEQLKDFPLEAVSKGVYAKQSQNASYTVVKENEVEYVVYQYTIKGNIVKIKVPKGQNPPPQNIVESLE